MSNEGLALVLYICGDFDNALIAGNFERQMSWLQASQDAVARDFESVFRQRTGDLFVYNFLSV